MHAYAVCDLKLDFDDPQAPVVATEICGTSISSQGPPKKETLGLAEQNPHIHYVNGDARGYVRVELSKGKAEVALRAIESEKVPDSPVRTIAQYVVEADRPGAHSV